MTVVCKMECTKHKHTLTDSTVIQTPQYVIYLEKNTKDHIAKHTIMFKMALVP